MEMRDLWRIELRINGSLVVLILEDIRPPVDGTKIEELD